MAACELHNWEAVQRDSWLTGGVVWNCTHDTSVHPHATRLAVTAAAALIPLLLDCGGSLFKSSFKNFNGREHEAYLVFSKKKKKKDTNLCVLRN